MKNKITARDDILFDEWSKNKRISSVAKSNAYFHHRWSNWYHIAINLPNFENLSTIIIIIIIVFTEKMDIFSMDLFGIQ